MLYNTLYNRRESECVMPRKGQHWTEEQKRARSEQTRRKWQDPEYRSMMSKALKGHSFSDAGRAKISAARKGKPLSEEHKAVLRIRSLEHWQDEQFRAKVLAGINDPQAKAKRYTSESNAKKSAAKRQYWANLPAEERRRRTLKWSKAGAEGARIKLRGRIPTEKQRAATSAGLKRKWRNAAWRKSIIAKARARFANMTEAEQQARLATMRAAFVARTGPTSIERAVAAALDALGIAYVAQKYFGPYIVDFCLSQYRLVLEADGDYWHNRPGEKERDAKRDRWFASRGWQTIRLSQAEIKRDALAVVQAALNPFIQEA